MGTSVSGTDGGATATAAAGSGGDGGNGGSGGGEIDSSTAAVSGGISTATGAGTISTCPLSETGAAITMSTASDRTFRMDFKGRFCATEVATGFGSCFLPMINPDISLLTSISLLKRSTESSPNCTRVGRGDSGLSPMATSVDLSITRSSIASHKTVDRRVRRACAGPSLRGCFSSLNALPRTSRDLPFLDANKKNNTR